MYFVNRLYCIYGIANPAKLFLGLSVDLVNHSNLNSKTIYLLKVSNFEKDKGHSQESRKPSALKNH